MSFLLDNHVWLGLVIVLVIFIYNFIQSKNGKLNITGAMLLERYFFVEKTKAKRRKT